jgi:outer membrane receptor protein involved in Fe transport
VNLALAPTLLAACLVQGDVASFRGAPLPDIEIVHARSGEALGVSRADGSFAIEAPDSPDGEVVLEFRHEDWLTRVERFRCGGLASVRLAPRVYEMEFFEVSATRLERSWESTPESVQELDEGEVVRAAGSSPSLAQAVQQLPGVGAVGRDGFTSAPTIRGMGRDRSLILLEGVRLSADRGVGPSGSFLDPFLIRDVAVVRGASGVAYGSGAIGGVLSVGLGPVSEERSVAGRLESATNGDGRLVAGRLGGALGRGWRGAVGGFARAADDYSFPAGDGPRAGDARNTG